MVSYPKLKQKRRGSLTPAVAVLLILTITVSAVVIDYSRLSYSKPQIETYVKNAINVALLNYESDIYDHYHLYTLTDLEELSLIINKQINNVISDEGFTFNDFQIDEITIEFTESNLSRVEDLRHMIIENHSRAFVSDELFNWLERLKAFKYIDHLSSIINKFSMYLGDVETLEADYQVIVDGYQNFIRWRNHLQSIDLNAICRSLKTARLSMERIDYQMTEHIATYDDASLSKETRIKYQEKLTELYASYDNAKTVVDEIQEKLDQFQNLSQSVQDFTEDLSRFSVQLDNVINTGQALLGEITILSQQIDSEYAQKTLTSVIDYINQILYEVTEFNKTALRQVQLVQNVNRQLNQLMVDIERFLAGEIAQIAQSTSIIDNSEDIGLFSIALLERQIKGSEKINAAHILNILWRMTLGPIVKQKERSDQISRQVYRQLPSKKHFAVPRSASLQAAGHNYKGDLIKKSQTVKSMAQALQLSAERLIEKTVVVHYITSHFSNKLTPDAVNSLYLGNTECEYILNGHRLASDNVSATQIKLFGMRFLLNVASILAFQQEILNNITAELAAASGGISYPLIYGVLLAGWSTVETIIDLRALNDGGAVILFKLKDDLAVNLTVEQLLNFNYSEILKSAKAKQSLDEIRALNYIDYVFLLMMMQQEDEQLMRVMDAIEMSKHAKSKTVESMKTALNVRITVAVNSWFADFLNYQEISHQGAKHHFTFEYTRGF